MNGNDATAHSLIQHTPKSVTTVAILGAESTGKTTLCRDLAAYTGSLWVPEYMRTYLQTKWDDNQQSCTWDDLLPIAEGQVALENQLAQQAAHTAAAEPYLFCDTTLFELMVYANWYYDDCPFAITQAALSHHYDLIILTEVDVPWVADDLRDSPYQRQEISDSFAECLYRHNKPFRRIGGDRNERVEQVTQWLAKRPKT